MTEKTLKVVLGFDLGEDFIAGLREEFTQVDFRIGVTPQDQAREAVDAEVIWGTMHREGFAAAGNLKWYCSMGIGFDGLLSKIPELKKSDVTMTISRGAHVGAMADWVFAMILAFAHRLRDSLEDQRNHVWDTLKYRRTITELAGTTMGILAFGGIGRSVAKRAAGFDMEVFAADMTPTPAPPGVREVWGLDRLDELLRISDWLVVTAPMTPQTAGMIGRERLAKIKKGAHVFVVSRGGIIEEEALAEALQSGRVAGAALDALVHEPPRKDDPLWDLPNVIITAHTSAESAGTIDRRAEIFKENLRRYIAGEPLMFEVDKSRGF